jgi:hypothetical protein
LFFLEATQPGNQADLPSASSLLPPLSLEEYGMVKRIAFLGLCLLLVSCHSMRMESDRRKSPFAGRQWDISSVRYFLRRAGRKDVWCTFICFADVDTDEEVIAGVDHPPTWVPPYIPLADRKHTSAPGKRQGQTRMWIGTPQSGVHVEPASNAERDVLALLHEWMREHRITREMAKAILAKQVVPPDSSLALDRYLILEMIRLLENRDGNRDLTRQ